MDLNLAWFLKLYVRGFMPHRLCPVLEGQAAKTAGAGTVGLCAAAATAAAAAAGGGGGGGRHEEQPPVSSEVDSSPSSTGADDGTPCVSLSPSQPSTANVAASLPAITAARRLRKQEQKAAKQQRKYKKQQKLQQVITVGYRALWHH